MFRVAFTKVGAILCALKGISSEQNAASNNRENCNECLIYQNKVILQWKYWWVSFELALGWWGNVHYKNFINWFYTNPILILLFFSKFKIPLSLVVYCARAIRNFWLCFMPNDNFRMLICGPSGYELLYYDKFYL